MARVLALLVGVAAPAGARTWVVDQRSPRAADSGPGTERRPLKTISRAAELAQPGDTVRVHAGVYREWVRPARGGVEGRPITYVAAPGERVAVKGSEVWKPRWLAVPGRPGVFTGRLDPALFGAYNPYRAKLRNVEGRKTQGQVFVNGRPLTEVDSTDDLTRTPGSWMASAEGDAVSVHFPDGVRDPAGPLVELTVRNHIFAPVKRGLGYITVRGFTFEHCASDSQGGFWEVGAPPQAGEVSCRSGHHWVIENNIIRWCKAVGLDCGSETEQPVLDGQPTPKLVGYHLIRGNIVGDNGETGITGLGQIGTRILGNVIERNNLLHFNAVEEAGIKTHYLINGLIEGNLVRDNEADGIWVDNVWQGTRITRNVLINNRSSGIFVELGAGPGLVDHNIIAYTRPGTYRQDPRGDGFYSHDASGVTVAHNLIFGCANYGIFMRLSGGREHDVFPEVVTTFATRPLGEVQSTVSDTRILGNLVFNNRAGAINLRFPGEGSENNLSDYNVFDSPDSPAFAGDQAPLRFVVNAGAAQHGESLRAALNRVFAGLPESERPKMAGAYRTGPLTLEQWRALLGFDRHSGVSAVEELRLLGGERPRLVVGLAARP